jgi:hypothetical protein
MPDDYVTIPTRPEADEAFRQEPQLLLPLRRRRDCSRHEDKCAPGHLSKLFAETLFDCPVYRNYGQAIADQV